MTQKNGPLARNHSTGKIERMVEEEYEIKVWDRPARCTEISCMQQTGTSICKTTCLGWAKVKASMDDGTLSFTMQKRTRFVFKETEKE